MSECLSCLDLTKRFGAKEALRSVNFKLEKGRIVGLLGPNGSGKTTLLKLVSGLLQPTDGSVLIEGMPPGIETKRKVSYLPDQMYLGDWMRVRDIIEYFQDFYEDFDGDRARAMLETLGIRPSQKIRAMSKGTREKVQLILVMSRRASLYCLDEPIAGVDPGSQGLHSVGDPGQFSGELHPADLHPPDRGCGKYPGRGDFSEGGQSGAAVHGGGYPHGAGQICGRSFQGGVPMLRKLWKHEWKASCRLLLAVHLALLAMGLAGYLIREILTGSPVLSVLGGLYMILFFFLALAAFLLTHILLIGRYYRNFFTAEGYLVHTLPAGPGSKLLAKCLNHLVWSLINLACVLSAVMLVSSAVPSEGQWKSFLEALPRAAESMGFSSVPVMLLTVLGMLLLMLFTSILMFYAAISLGSLFPSHRILGSVLCWLGLWIANQIVNVVIMVSAFGRYAGLEGTVTEAGGIQVTLPPSQVTEIFGLFLGTAAAVTAVMGTAYYLISYFVLSKRLNLQ